MTDRDLAVKDYTETVTGRLTKEQVARLKRHAQSVGKSQSDRIRDWIENADLIPQIPPEVVSKLRYIGWGQKREPRRLIEDALRRQFRKFWG